MRKMTNDATAEDKLKAVRSGVAGFMAMQKVMKWDIPESMLKIFQNIIDDDYTDFVLFEPEDEEKRKQALSALRELETLLKENM